MMTNAQWVCFNATWDKRAIAKCGRSPVNWTWRVKDVTCLSCLNVLSTEGREVPRIHYPGLAGAAMCGALSKGPFVNELTNCRDCAQARVDYEMFDPEFLARLFADAFKPPTWPAPVVDLTGPILPLRAQPVIAASKAVNLDHAWARQLAREMRHSNFDSIFPEQEDQGLLAFLLRARAREPFISPYKRLTWRPYTQALRGRAERGTC